MEKTDNRTLLLRCANDLFYAKGYDAVGVQEIVDLAGLTKPTLYYYFGSKQGLLKSLLETNFAELRKMVCKLREEALDIRSALYRMAEVYSDFFERDRKFYMLMMALFYSARENEAYQAVKPYVTEFYENVLRIFECSADQLGNMKGRQRQFAVGFVGTIGLYFLMHCERDPENRIKIEKRQLVSLVNQFMYGIFT